MSDTPDRQTESPVENWPRLETLHDAGVYEADAEVGLKRLVALARRVLDVSESFVTLIDADNQVVKSSAGPTLSAGTILSIDGSVFQRAVELRSSMWIGDAEEEGWAQRAPLCRDHGLEAVTVIPMFDSKERVLGSFAAGDHEPYAWTEFDRDVLEALSESALTELELRAEIARREKIEERLRRAAILDPLTGLANRRLLWNRLGHAIDRAERTGAVLAVLYIDLDNFKSINDSYGHSTGDELLTRIAERLQSTVRDQDTVSRLGGDEFVILLEGVGSTDEVEDAVERVHDNFVEPFELTDGRVRCEASIGWILSRPAGERDGIPSIDEPDELVEHADRAMYEAKRRGVAHLVADHANDE
ncbi:MAG: diguanylate cyclase domain-containing protein [Bradymonadaceae bacterium]